MRSTMVVWGAVGTSGVVKGAVKMHNLNLILVGCYLLYHDAYCGVDSASYYYHITLVVANGST